MCTFNSFSGPLLPKNALIHSDLEFMSCYGHISKRKPNQDTKHDGKIIYGACTRSRHSVGVAEKWHLPVWILGVRKKNLLLIVKINVKACFSVFPHSVACQYIFEKFAELHLCAD